MEGNITVDPELTSIRSCLQNNVNDNNIVTITIGNGGGYVKIDMEHPKVSEFLLDVQEQLGKRKYTKHYKRSKVDGSSWDHEGVDKWESKALERISEEIKEHFGEYGSAIDIEDHGIEVFEGVSNLNRVADDMDDSKRKMIDDNVLDCNPITCLTSVALAQNCPNKGHDFYIFNAHRYSNVEHNDFMNGEPVKTVTINGNKYPIGMSHAAIVSGFSGNVLDATQGQVFYRKQKSGVGVADNADGLMNEYNLYESELNGLDAQVIFTFGDQMYKRNERGEIEPSDTYALRVLQYKAAYALEYLVNNTYLNSSGKDEYNNLRDALEAYAYNIEGEMTDRNAALSFIAFETTVRAADGMRIDYKEFNEILTLGEHMKYSAEEIMHPSIEGVEEIFKDMDISVQDVPESPTNDMVFPDKFNFDINGTRYSLPAELDGVKGYNPPDKGR